MAQGYCLLNVVSKFLAMIGPLDIDCMDIVFKMLLQNSLTEKVLDIDCMDSFSNVVSKFLRLKMPLDIGCMVIVSLLCKLTAICNVFLEEKPVYIYCQTT